MILSSTVVSKLADSKSELVETVITRTCGSVCIGGLKISVFRSYLEELILCILHVLLELD